MVINYHQLWEKHGKMVMNGDLMMANYELYTMISILTSITGWWFQPTPLKNDGVKVSWDDDVLVGGFNHLEKI